MSKNISKKIKIVHIISSLKIGGAEAVLVDLIRTLGSKRYEHNVLYFHRGAHEDRLRELGVRMHYIEGLFCRYDLIFFIRLYKLIKYINPDVIHSSLWVANFSARIIGPILNIPVICAIHLGIKTDGALRNILDQFTLRFADRVVVISDTVAQSLYDRPSWIEPAKVSVIKNGIDKERVITLKKRNEQRRGDHGFNEDHIIIGSVGRFIPRKNFPMLLEVFGILHKQYKNVRLIIIGYGSQESELRAIANDFNIYNSVTFITGKTAYGYYALMDIFVLPSFQEGLSIALLEAMSCGLPCIVSNTSQKHDVIRNDYNGIIVPAGNMNKLILAIERVIVDKLLRIQLGLNAQKTVEQNFSIHNTAQEYENLYKSVTFSLESLQK